MIKLFLVFALVFSGSCFSQDKIKDTELGENNGLLSVELMIEGSNQFAFDFYQQLKKGTKNICFSPYSIIWGLSLVSLGASGETAMQLQQTLNYPLSFLPSAKELKTHFFSNSKPSIHATQILMAVKLWINKEIVLKPSYKNLFQSYFNEEPQFFSSLKNKAKDAVEMNQWVLKNTNNKIKDIIDSRNLNEKTMLVLTTAMTMKGKWVHPFDRLQTKFLSFNVPKRTIQVEMMDTIGSFLMWKGSPVDLIVLPYLKMENDIQLAMNLIIPNSGIDIEKIENEMTLKQWQNWQKNLRQDMVRIVLPRFKVEQQIDLNTPLKSLGLKSAFLPTANFKAMSDQKDIHLSLAVHKTLLKIDEIGTDVGGSTYGFQNEKSHNQEILIDRPFIYIVSDINTGAIFFMGRILQP
ncbi:MAG: serpin family protein [Parachlamydiaceae bacterium]|nr:serpin family protein [Parachlamydiaceae bacterium]